MEDSADRLITERLAELSRTVFPVNYILSKTYEYAAKHPTCAMAIVTNTGCQVNFTKPIQIEQKMLEKRSGAFVYRNHLYYVKELKIINSYLVLVPDEFKITHTKDPSHHLEDLSRAVQPYIKEIEEILRQRFANIFIRIPKEEKPLILRRQAVKGKQMITIDELFIEMRMPREISLPTKEVMFRGKTSVVLPKQKRRKGKEEAQTVSISYFALEDGRIVLPKHGVIQAGEYVQLGEIPYHFEVVEGPVPERKIITSFLQLGNKSIAQLLEESSELVFLPFFFDLYIKQGGPPVRHVALMDGRLIIGRTPESTRNIGKFEVFLSKADIEISSS
ncbi:MAG: hypothetical protein ACFFDP_03780 [Promethearchaeota archaeon]